MTETMEPIRITGEVSMKPAPVKDLGFSGRTYVSNLADSSTGSVAKCILSHIPNRERAVITFAGAAAGDSCVLAGSAADAARGEGTTIVTDGNKTHSPLVLCTTAEVWLAPVIGSVTVGVVSEIRAM